MRFPCSHDYLCLWFALRSLAGCCELGLHNLRWLNPLCSTPVQGSHQLASARRQGKPNPASYGRPSTPPSRSILSRICKAFAPRQHVYNPTLPADFLLIGLDDLLNSKLSFFPSAQVLLILCGLKCYRSLSWFSFWNTKMCSSVQHWNFDVLAILQAGYRHIDCAPAYRNEKEVINNYLSSSSQSDLIDPPVLAVDFFFFYQIKLTGLYSLKTYVMLDFTVIKIVCLHRKCT